jgi:polyhydroxyalkanoate synthesis repressor PhaR
MNEVRLIRKYANRRLYDTVRSRYVNLADVRNLIAEGIRVRVVEQSSTRDITNSILLQIIGGMERDDGALLTTGFLTDLIKAAGSESSDPGLPERLQSALRGALPAPALHQ